MVPSSLTISQNTPAGYKPARLGEIAAASVCRGRFQHAAGAGAQRKTWPGRAKVCWRAARVHGGLDRFRARSWPKCRW